MRRNVLRVAGVHSAAVAVCLSGLFFGVAARAQEANFESLLADKGPAMVTIKFILKSRDDDGGDNEIEAAGVVIEPDGLVLCASSSLGTGRGMAAAGASPTQIKVLEGDDLIGVDAKVVARDSELDLTWLRMKAPEGKKYRFVDLAKSVQPKVGDRLFSIVRMGKYFDRAAVVRETRVGGITRKPRHLLVPSMPVAALGLPVFGATGEVVGIPVVQRPELDEMRAAGGMQAFAGGNGVIVPAGDVMKATQRAKENASEDQSDEDDSAASAPVDKKDPK